VSDVAPVLQAADLFAFPSEKEGMSNALLEAMASGLAIVATDYAGVRDVIVHEESGLVAANDPGSFGHCLSRLASDAALRARLGAKARDRATGSHSLETHAMAYRSLIERLVASRKARAEQVS
jgi:glycosyltransferase involved in cell wall biosynthesis